MDKVSSLLLKLSPTPAAACSEVAEPVALATGGVLSREEEEAESRVVLVAQRSTSPSRSMAAAAEAASSPKPKRKPVTGRDGMACSRASAAEDAQYPTPDYETIRVNNIRDVVKVREVIHRKENDKVAVYRVRTLQALGSVPRGRELVVKLIQNRKEGTEELFVNEFLAHLRCTAVQHPNILHCYPIRLETTTKSHFAVTTPYIRERSITNLNAAATSADALKIVTDVAKALKRVHECGYAHCDIKRENIVFETWRGARTYILMDFGSVRLLGRAYTRSQGAGYTTSYAPPEVFSRGASEDGTLPSQVYHCTPALDVFELGVLSLRVCQQRPWKKAVCTNAHFSQFAEAIEAGQPPHWGFDISQVPLELQPILPAMLHPNPGKRCSIDDILSALPEPGTQS